MTNLILRRFACMTIMLCAVPFGAGAQSAFGVTYGSDECNNDTSYLTENNIDCTAVFSETNVWDFLENLPRRITYDELIALNPRLEIESYETILTGITFIRVR